MGTYCQVITSKWFVCCELAREREERGCVKSWLSKNGIDSGWTFSLKSGNIPSGFPSPVSPGSPSFLVRYGPGCEQKPKSNGDGNRSAEPCRHRTFSIASSSAPPVECPDS